MSKKVVANVFDIVTGGCAGLVAASRAEIKWDDGGGGGGRRLDVITSQVVGAGNDVYVAGRPTDIEGRQVRFGMRSKSDRQNRLGTNFYGNSGV